MTRREIVEKHFTQGKSAIEIFEMTKYPLGYIRQIISGLRHPNAARTYRKNWRNKHPEKDGVQKRRQRDRNNAETIAQAGNQRQRWTLNEVLCVEEQLAGKTNREIALILRRSIRSIEYVVRNLEALKKSLK